MPVDIAVNITDEQYLGVYMGKHKHEKDVEEVIKRAQEDSVKMVFLGTSLGTSIESMVLAESYTQYATIGIHPGSAEKASEEDIRCIEDILRENSIEKYKNLIRSEYIPKKEIKNPIETLIAIGEVGLDYYRDYSCKSKQREVFSRMMDLSSISSLPYLFHYRECQRDFLEITDGYSVNGVVHSFTGSVEEMKILVKKGYYIGINGASIRENTHTHVIEEIPEDRILLETDAPWCSIRKSSEYYKYTNDRLKPGKAWKKENGRKGRNEPVNLHQVIDIVAHIKNMTQDELIVQTDKNFYELFK
ncbi:TatD DNase family protein [Nematocida sp. LUAm3]|nr:TatD DNase family protein [Nematocida sp. LUAm3]KAI5176006.1 TatD DNase family protein [Nematocida sp. LUAm2]KAI5179103.1 TatD DNase family protein [Nematocida sp. LUAm1]